MVEEERKYDVGTRFAVPDLAGCLPSGGRILDRPAVTLTATYFDTADLRLARAGVSLRYRRGDTEPWTVKLPTAAHSPGVRHEISRSGPAGTPPKDLVALVTVYARAGTLAPAAVLRTVRRSYELRDGADRVLAELADDTVSVLDGRRVRTKFREIEVERGTGDRNLLDRVEEALRAAGATSGVFTPKHLRALGPAASGEPDLPEPVALARNPRAADVVTAAIRRDVARMLRHDPLVRLRAPVGADDTAVHQMRVGCRRLRSDLRTFGPLLDTGWAGELRAELKWVANALGAARDAEVLRTRLRRTSGADPLCPPDEAAVERIDAQLAARQQRALADLDEVLGSERYRVLVDTLIDAAGAPRLASRARSRAADVLPRLVAKPWRRFAYGTHGVDGAAGLDPLAPDTSWHEVRILGKRARYAVEAVADVLGGEARKLGKALSAVQDVLGEHQDAAVAGRTWLAAAGTEPDDHDLAVTAGRLFERERAAVRAARSQFPAAWRAASKRRLVEWLP